MIVVKIVEYEYGARLLIESQPQTEQLRSSERSEYAVWVLLARSLMGMPKR